MSKSLSTGTLSLRFMQNALRRQQLEQVELERAEVKDEGKWEVGQDIKDAWGIGQETERIDSVEYESSYLPFLFSSEHEDTASHTYKPLGRRVFDKKGQDVSQSQSQSQSQTQQAVDNAEGDGSASESEPATGLNDGATSSFSAQYSEQDEFLTKGRKFKVHANPKSISSAFGRDLKGFDAFDLRKSVAGQSAREAIFNSLNGVGTDLRPTKSVIEDRKVGEVGERPTTELPKQKQKQKQEQRSTGFLKPSGVDEPASRKIASDPVSGGKSSKIPLPDIIDGARKKRPLEGGDPDDGHKKQKKKKRKAAADPL